MKTDYRLRTDLTDHEPSMMLRWRVDPNAKPEKMSKSRGNAISVDMALNTIHELAKGWEFRDMLNRRIENWRDFGIWQNKNGDGMFYCGSSTAWLARELSSWPGTDIPPSWSHLPVFLCDSKEVIPPRLLINGHEVMQHPHLFDFWDAMAKAFPDEFEECLGPEAYYTPVSDYEKAGVYSQIG